MITSPREYRKAVLDLLPQQGDWSEEDYLWLTDHSNRLIELTDGYLEVLPTPTDEHQGILSFLDDEFKRFIGPRGVVRFAPLRVRLRSGKFREPDLLLLLDRADPRRENRYWHGADLVLEVVSPDQPARPGRQAPRIRRGRHPRVLDRQPPRWDDRRADLAEGHVRRARQLQARDLGHIGLTGRLLDRRRCDVRRRLISLSLPA